MVAALVSLAFVLPGPACAHLVPPSSHDRTIVVRLGWDKASQSINVLVDYRLEVDELTVALTDMDPFRKEAEPARFRNKRLAYYGEFARIYAPILAGNLVSKGNGKDLDFTCIKRQPQLKDEKGQELGHLRCDFRFRATFPAAAGARQQFKFREGNYELQTGKIDLSLAADGSIRILTKSEPEAVLKKRAETELKPGDDEKLRQVSATFEKAPQSNVGGKSREGIPSPGANVPGSPGVGSLLRLFLDAGDRWFWALLLAAAGFGAAHALTPGHGKTLVAAYLVGQRGTTLHAVILGLVTTLTHTGVVLVIAVGLRLAAQETREMVAAGLGLTMGLAIIGLGSWRLLCNLAGRADHIHIGGHGHHHHHHGPADHSHDEHGHVIPARGPLGWGGLVVLGMSGGIVPCWDAVAMLVLAVGMGQLDLALPLLLAFSAGLAAVLVLVGVLVVHVRGFADSHWGEGRLVRALPALSALAITVLGFWLCYESVHPGS
jgi:nickel/cobalt exporter